MSIQSKIEALNSVKLSIFYYLINKNKFLSVNFYIDLLIYYFKNLYLFTFYKYIVFYDTILHSFLQ